MGRFLVCLFDCFPSVFVYPKKKTEFELFVSGEFCVCVCAFVVLSCLVVSFGGGVYDLWSMFSNHFLILIDCVSCFGILSKTMS